MVDWGYWTYLDDDVGLRRHCRSLPVPVSVTSRSFRRTAARSFNHIKQRHCLGSVAKEDSGMYLRVHLIWVADLCPCLRRKVPPGQKPTPLPQNNHTQAMTKHKRGKTGSASATTKSPSTSSKGPSLGNVKVKGAVGQGSDWALTFLSFLSTDLTFLQLTTTSTHIKTQSKPTDASSYLIGENFYRDAKKAKMVNMLKGGTPTRNADGKIIKAAAFQSKLASGTVARVEPNRKWFENTRTVGVKQLEQFREAMAAKANDPYTFLMKQNKLPMSLMTDSTKTGRVKLLETESFSTTFGPNAQRKRPKVMVGSMEEMVNTVETKNGWSWA